MFGSSVTRRVEVAGRERSGESETKRVPKRQLYFALSAHGERSFLVEAGQFANRAVQRDFRFAWMT